MTRVDISKLSHQGGVMQAQPAPSKLSFKQKFGLFCLALFCILVSVFVFAPATWLNHLLQAETKGRLAIIEAEGSLWNGSGYFAMAANPKDELTPLLPGRFEWHLSPILLLGQIELEIRNPETLQQPLHFTGNLSYVQISPGSLVLPASRLVGLGAPLNTVKPSGKMILSWGALGLTFDQNLHMDGRMKLTMENISSALSPVKPLGSYFMDFDWHGAEANLELKTIKGPLLLTGNGRLNHGRLKFSGLAESEPEYEGDLATLLNLLGQRRSGAGKNVIALEFK